MFLRCLAFVLVLGSHAWREPSSSLLLKLPVLTRTLPQLAFLFGLFGYGRLQRVDCSCDLAWSLINVSWLRVTGHWHHDGWHAVHRETAVIWKCGLLWHFRWELSLFRLYTLALCLILSEIGLVLKRLAVISHLRCFLLLTHCGQFSDLSQLLAIPIHTDVLLCRIRGNHNFLMQHLNVLFLLISLFEKLGLSLILLSILTCRLFHQLRLIRWLRSNWSLHAWP